MQRKALKQVCSLYHTSQGICANRQLGKVTQWTNEKVFSGEKTQLSSEFTQFERDIEIKKNGIERYVSLSHMYSLYNPPLEPPHGIKEIDGTGDDRVK